MITFLKRNYLWVLLFGSLIGINETFIGSINMPYRSVVLSAITLFLLSIARSYFPKRGTSLLIMIIAVLFKMNTIGFNSCSPTVFLCGPTVLLLLGIGYEVFAEIFIKQNTFKYLNILMICITTSLFAFSLFALMNTYILRIWDTSRLIQYIFIKGSLTAIVSSVISVLGLYLARGIKYDNLVKLNPYIINGILSCLVIILWVLGSYSL